MACFCSDIFFYILLESNLQIYKEKSISYLFLTILFYC